LVLKVILPPAEFGGERCIQFAISKLVGIIPKAVMAMATIQPPGMIEDRIQANSV
jgi:hypothetical protein